jgi:hypothetical protein
MKILAFIPESTDPCGKLIYSIPSKDREDQWVGKVDYQINERQSIFARYFIAKHTVPAAFDGKNLLLMSQQISVGKDDMVQTGSIGHTYTFNQSTLNRIHVGFQRSAIERLPTPGVPTWQELGAGVLSPVKGYFNLTITNYFTPLHGNNNPAPWAATTFMFSDDFSMTSSRSSAAVSTPGNLVGSRPICCSGTSHSRNSFRATGWLPPAIWEIARCIKNFRRPLTRWFIFPEDVSQASMG